ncbi:MULTISPECIES: hypothetical protein [unclassified Streptomyces]|uniref:hypothetical protein n=1 Tax=unclassified Streptomyces TaxID=2593676 RepID=UPI002E120989|nr:hypothetical protein OG324_10145 [Streptomyces sp. NBC_01236]
MYKPEGMFDRDFEWWELVRSATNPWPEATPPPCIPSQAVREGGSGRVGPADERRGEV